MSCSNLSGGHPCSPGTRVLHVGARPPRRRGLRKRPLNDAVSRVLRSESNHLSQLWDEASGPQRLLMLALADEPTESVYSAGYHERHELPATPTLQTALNGLIKKEIVSRSPEDGYRIVEPFLPEWLRREQSPATITA